MDSPRLASGLFQTSDAYVYSAFQCPITYAVGGRQYVAVSTGSGWATSGILGILGLTPELSSGIANMLFVFALPQ